MPEIWLSTTNDINQIQKLVICDVSNLASPCQSYSLLRFVSGYRDVLVQNLVDYCPSNLCLAGTGQLHDGLAWGRASKISQILLERMNAIAKRKPESSGGEVLPVKKGTI